jgi:ABC-type spermidine/putrescine transport system permease subunit II
MPLTIPACLGVTVQAGSRSGWTCQARVVTGGGSGIGRTIAHRLAAALASRLVIAIPYAWLLLLFLAPFLIVFKISLSTTTIAMPPYTPTFELREGWVAFWQAFGELTFENYRWLIDDALYVNAYISSVVIAGISTVLALAIGYPLAYAMARAPSGLRYVLLMLVILPFWTSFLIRVYAWIGILRPEGFLNQLLMGLGLIDAPLVILGTHTAIFIGIVYSYLPFMVLPSTPILRGWISRSSRPRRTSARRLPPPSGRSRSRFRYRASWRAACWSSFPPSASSSFPIFWAARAR